MPELDGGIEAGCQDQNQIEKLPQPLEKDMISYSYDVEFVVNNNNNINLI